MSERASFCVEAMVRATIPTKVFGRRGTTLQTVNPWDSFAVAVLKDEAISFVRAYKSIVTSLAG